MKNNSTFSILAAVIVTSIFISCDKHEKRETKYDNGQLHEQFSVLETKEGSFIKDGEYKTWFPSGQPESEGVYEAGKQMGNWKYWYSNGQMKSDYNLVRDTLDGSFIKWYENGQKLIEGTKKMGVEVGPWTSWYENGQMNEKLNYYQDGKTEGLQTKWHSNGQKASEVNFLKGVKEGECKFWDTKGKQYITRIFKAGADINLPSTYKHKSGEKMELLTDGTYKMTYLESFFFSSQWKNKSGQFEVTADNLKLNGFKTFALKKFNADTIVVDGYRGDIVFVKVTDSK